MIYHIDPKVMYVPLTLVNIERRVHSDLKATLMLNSLQTHLMSSLISGHIGYYHQRSLLLSLIVTTAVCCFLCGALQLKLPGELVCLRTPMWSTSSEGCPAC